MNTDTPNQEEIEDLLKKALQKIKFEHIDELALIEKELDTLSVNAEANKS